MRALVLCLLLTACATQQQPAAWQPRKAVRVDCDAQCKAECLPKKKEDWPSWVCADPDAPECWDNHPENVDAPMKDIAERCDAGRVACVLCLETIERRRVVCGFGTDC